MVLSLVPGTLSSKKWGKERAWDQGVVATLAYARVKFAHALVTMTWKILTIIFYTYTS